MKTFFYSKTQEKDNVPVYEVLTAKGWKKFTQTVNDEVYKLDGVPDAKVAFIMFGETEPYIRENGKIINMELYKCKLTWKGKFKNPGEDSFNTNKFFYTQSPDIIVSNEVFFKSKNQNKYVKIQFIIEERGVYPGYKYIGYAVPVDDTVKENFDKREICRKTNLKLVKETVQRFADEFCIPELPEELKREEELKSKLNLPENLFESIDKEIEANQEGNIYPPFLRGLTNNVPPGGIIVIDKSSSDGDDMPDEIKRFLKQFFGIDFDD